MEVNRRDFVGLTIATTLAPIAVIASPSRVAWFAMDLAAAKRFGSSADEVVPAASLIKLLIAKTLIADAARGSLDLSTPVLLETADRVPGSDQFGTARPGLYPLGDLVAAMLSLSDNTASNALLRFSSEAKCNAVAKALGLRATRVRRKFYDWSAQRRGLENTTSAREICFLMVQLLHDSEALGKAQPVAQHVFQSLLRQSDRETIPAALTEEGTVANKTGELIGVRSDVALVLAKCGYVMAVIDTYEGSRHKAIADVRRVFAQEGKRFVPC